MANVKLKVSTKKWILLIGIVLISLGGFNVVNTLDLNPTFNLCGLLLTCQVGFLLFFLSRVRFRKLN